MALQFAVEAGNASLIRSLLQHPQIDINCKVVLKKSAITEAIAFGDADIVAVFLTRANIQANVQEFSTRWVQFLHSQSNTSLLVAALENGHQDFITLLLSSPSTVLKPELTTCLRHTIDYGNMAFLQRFLDTPGFSINSSLIELTGLSIPPLSYAIRSGKYQVVKLMLGYHSVDPNSLDSAGLTPLHYAVKARNSRVVELLLARVDIQTTARDTKGRTPLALALKHRSAELVSHLQDYERKFPARIQEEQIKHPRGSSTYD